MPSYATFFPTFQANQNHIYLGAAWVSMSIQKHGRCYQAVGSILTRFSTITHCRFPASILFTEGVGGGGGGTSGEFRNS